MKRELAPFRIQVGMGSLVQVDFPQVQSSPGEVIVCRWRPEQMFELTGILFVDPSAQLLSTEDRDRTLQILNVWVGNMCKATHLRSVAPNLSNIGLIQPGMDLMVEIFHIEDPTPLSFRVCFVGRYSEDGPKCDTCGQHHAPGEHTPNAYCVICRHFHRTGRDGVTVCRDWRRECLCAAPLERLAPFSDRKPRT